MMPEFRGTVHCLKNKHYYCCRVNIICENDQEKISCGIKKKHVCMCRKVIYGICLSGKGIGKALMSKVAQVSKTSIHNWTVTVKTLFFFAG